MHSPIQRSGLRAPELADPKPRESVRYHHDALRNQQRHDRQSGQQECALPAHRSERARCQQCTRSRSRSPFLARSPQQPPQLRRYIHVINHQRPRTPKQPDPHHHQQPLQNNHRRAPLRIPKQLKPFRHSERSRPTLSLPRSLPRTRRPAQSSDCLLCQAFCSTSPAQLNAARASRARAFSRINNLCAKATRITRLGFPLAAIRSANAAKSALYRRTTPATTYKIARTLRRPPRTALFPSRLPLSCASGATPANFDTALLDNVPISGRSASTRATVRPATPLIERNASSNFCHSGSLANNVAISASTSRICCLAIFSTASKVLSTRGSLTRCRWFF